MNNTQQIGQHATSTFTQDGITRVVYHNTAIVTFDDGLIELESGGWRTQTTKARMNQASQQFDLGFQVYQSQNVWYVDYKGKTLKFEDGLELPR